MSLGGFTKSQIRSLRAIDQGIMERCQQTIGSEEYKCHAGRGEICWFRDGNGDDIVAYGDGIYVSHTGRRKFVAWTGRGHGDYAGTIQAAIARYLELYPAHREGDR